MRPEGPCNGPLFILRRPRKELVYTIPSFLLWRCHPFTKFPSCDHRVRMDPSQVCLEIAIDHRIKRIFNPVEKAVSKFNVEYASQLHNIAIFVNQNVRQLSQHERQVTTELARSHGNGDIVILLQQPAKNHPFHLGKDTTIEASPTLNALDQAFRTASCGTLTLSDIDVVDSLPYIRPCDNIKPGIKLRLRELFLKALHARKPRVVLCAWRDDQAGASVRDLMSLGIGKIFTDGHLRTVEGLNSIRVNAFHPSHAMNHRPAVSRLRQLLLLEVAQACHQSYGEWQEQDWMQQLRAACKSSARCYSSKLSLYHQRRLLGLQACRLK